MWAIYKRELKSYFTSMLAYFVLAFYMLSVGVFYFAYCVASYLTDFSAYVIPIMTLITLIFAPMITMRIIAGDRKNRTDQLLYTSPVSVREVVLGKYLAAFTLFGIGILTTFIYPVLITFFGDLPIGNIISGYVGYVLFVTAVLAIGMFISSLTDNSVVAGLITFIIFILFYISGYITYYLPTSKISTFILLGTIIVAIMGFFYYSTRKIKSTLASGVICTALLVGAYVYKSSWFEAGIPNMFNWLSLIMRNNQFSSGLFSLENIVFMISITAIFIFLTIQVINRRRWNLVKNTKKSLISSSIMVGFIAILLVINVIVDNLNITFDLSSDNVYTISDQTKSIVEAIDEEVTLYVLDSEDSFDVGYKEILNKYKKISKNIKIEYKDLTKNPTFASTYIDSSIEPNAGSIIVVCDDHEVYVDSADYISTDQSGYTVNQVIDFEPLITTALLNVTTGNVYNISTITGHGEASFASNISKYISGDNFQVSDLALYTEESVPETTDILVINGPTEDYAATDIDKLNKYIKTGGKVYVIINPVATYLDKLYGLLGDYGINVVDGVVVEGDENSYIQDTAYYILPTLKASDITDSLRENNYQVLTLRSKGLSLKQVGDYKVTSLLATSNSAFSKIEMVDDSIDTKSDNDIDGPFSIAAISENEKEGSMIVLGSTDALMDEVDEQVGGNNSNFFVNGLDYLCGVKEQIEMRGTKINNATGLYTSRDQAILFVLSIFVIPLLYVILGIVVKIRRNKNSK